MPTRRRKPGWKSNRPAQRRAATVLEVLAGVRMPLDAAAALGIGLPRYYLLEQRALRGLLAACEPRGPGQTRSDQKQIALLEREVGRLKQECARQQALEVIPETLAGQRTIPDACEALGIQESMFHKMRGQVLQTALDRLEPRPAGRPPRLPSPPEQYAAELEEQVEQLRVELKAAEVRRELAEKLPRLSKPAVEPGKKRRAAPSDAGDVAPAGRRDQRDRRIPKRHAPPRLQTLEARLARATRATGRRARRALAFERWAQRRGLTRHEAAERLGVAPHWERRWHQDGMAAHANGRPSRRSDPSTRNAAIRLMTISGPRTGLATLRAAFPTLACAELQDLQRRFRRLWRRDHRRLLHVLHWHCPGTVWAMAHTEAPEPIDGRCSHILAVRDLASHKQLGWLPVTCEDSQETCRALEGLFRRHGAPLVLKSDNGAGFIGEDTRKLLAQWEVFPLFSPPRTPQYNGSCEAGNGAMKNRTEHQAILGGRPGHWTAGALEAAREIANCTNRPWGHRGPTPAEVWRRREPITAARRAAFGRTVGQHREQARDVLGYPKNEPLGRKARARIDRLALRRTCVECGLLTFTRRSITPPIQSRIATKVS